ncbi:MAG: GDSL-type esterase/lipase family protein [Pseudomonadales bacterium]|nr:GDSL-type esterase/lipase family protein [Pseudomonadales bacterium]
MPTNNATIIPFITYCLICFGLIGCKAQYPHPAAWELQVQAIEEQDAISPPPENAIVIFGSSSIHMWETIEEDLAPLPIIARGFFGNTMNDARYYADRMITAYNPDVIIIYEGDNDFSFGIGLELFRSTYLQFVENVRKTHPTVPIYFISIKPSVSRWDHWPIRESANAIVTEICAEDEYLHYIDVASAMLDEDGNVREDLYGEGGLHMNDAGFELWIEIIKPILMAAYFGEEDSPDVL